jgi:predicted phage terminase large subunit-like protein
MQVQQTVELHRAQAAFCRSQALYRGFVGGRGAGKSYIGAYDLIRRAKPGRLYGVYAPSYPMMRDATMRSFMSLAQRFSYLRDMRRSDNQATLGNGAEVLFRSLDDPERARGPNLSGAWMDEASLVPLEGYSIIIASLRESGEQGWLSATFTPKGKGHWTYDTFGMGKTDTELFRARTGDNPFLPPEFQATLAKQYTSQLAAQELGGEFVDVEGALAQRDWFMVVDAVPPCNWVRAWDFAATEKSLKTDDPDYTVGVKLGRDGGAFYVGHVVRARVGPGAVERLVRQTAEVDGRDVRVVLEQEPGGAGKLFTAALIRNLAGWTIEAQPATGDKVTRAMPFMAQAQAGNVSVLRGPWLSEYLDELATFPVGVHDDQVDATAAAFAQLTKPVYKRPGAAAY